MQSRQQQRDDHSDYIRLISSCCAIIKLYFKHEGSALHIRLIWRSRENIGGVLSGFTILPF